MFYKILGLVFFLAIGTFVGWLIAPPLLSDLMHSGDPQVPAPEIEV